MTKKLLLVIVSLAAIYGLTRAFFAVFDDNEIDESYFEYEQNMDGTVTITDYEGGHKALNFPSEIEGKPVTELHIRSMTAFDHEMEIESVRLPSSLETMNGFRFGFLEHLDNIEVASDNEHFTSVDGILYSKDKTELIAVPLNKKLGDFKVPASVETIHEFAVAYNESLTSLEFEIGTNLETLGYGAFIGTENLESVGLPEGLKTIGSGAFKGTRIKEIEFPDSLETIGNYAFKNNEHLSSISFNEGLEIIGYSAFSGSGISAPGRIGTIELPSTIKEIGFKAFYVQDLTGTIHIPKSLEKLGENAFGINDFDTLTFEEGSKLEVIERNAFNRNQFSEVEIPPSVKRIEIFALATVTELTVTYPDTDDGTLIELQEINDEYPSLAPFNDDATIVVPDTLYDDYMDAPVYKEYYQDALVKASDYE